MISLASIGFTVGAALFVAYAYSLKSYKNAGDIPRSYIWAYYLLALTFLNWGIAAINGSQNILNASVLAGNIFMLAGTVLLTTMIVNKKGTLPSAAIIATILFIARILYAPPAPYMQDGILIFNTNSIVSAIYAILFIGIWLPANLKVGKVVGEKGRVPEFTKLLRLLFALSIIAAIFMPVARTPAVVTGAFVTLIVCYVVLIVVNISLQKK